MKDVEADKVNTRKRDMPSLKLAVNVYHVFCFISKLT